MSYKYESLENKTFGREVLGIDLKEIDRNLYLDLYSNLSEALLLIFRDQNLTVKDHSVLADWFGPTEFCGLLLSNQIEDNRSKGQISLDDQRMKTNLGNERWHMDSTYMPVSSKYGILSSIDCPEQGGETEFADTTVVLPNLGLAGAHSELASLSAYHSTLFSQANDLANFPTYDDNHIYHNCAYLRPLVRLNPDNNKYCLTIGRHAFGIPGKSRSDSRALLSFLEKSATQNERSVYTHKWSAGDVIIWDNRALLHRARTYDYAESKRTLLATRISGDPLNDRATNLSAEGLSAARKALEIELRHLTDTMPTS